MILFGLILGGIVLAAFAVVVISIHRSEYRNGLADPAHGFGDAFARKLLGLHVEWPSGHSSPARRRSYQRAGR